MFEQGRAGRLCAVVAVLLLLGACGSSPGPTGVDDEAPAAGGPPTATSPIADEAGPDAADESDGGTSAGSADGPAGDEPASDDTTSPTSDDAPRATTPTDPSGELEVHFIDVGQADATLLLAPDATILVDTGDWRGSEVVPYLRRAGVTHLDLVVVTHPHADHLGQFADVLAAFDVTEVWWSGALHTTQTFERAVTALEASSARYEEPRTGATVAFGSLLVDVLNPPRGVGLRDLHDSGLAVRVTYGTTRFLFTGDAEAATERRMVAADRTRLAADVYQVGHHGSRTSTTADLLAAVGPTIAVYSAGAGNSYGHPHREVIDRLRAAGVEVYGTDTHGTVVVRSDGRRLTVSTSRTPAPPPASTPTPTPSPTATSAPPSGLSVDFTSITSPVKRGAKATASVATAGGASCDITVTYKSGPSRAQGLDTKSAGSDGAVSWTWTVGSNTTPGDWPIEVRCALAGSSASAKTSFTVVE